jgi:hypothetical protein
MGRRSRKRASGPIAPPPPREEAAPPRAAAATKARSSAPRTATYKSRREDAPQPAWAPFPLTELAILISIIMLAAGFMTHDATRGVLLGGGFVLVTLSAGELAVREHYAGYRSHSSLLAGICAILCALPVWLAHVAQEFVLVVGVLVFAGGLFVFRRAFMRRSGGVGFRA